MAKQKDFSPMLAKDADPKLIRFPVLGSPKLDGIRAVTRDGKFLSRKLLPIPNLNIQKAFAQLPNGLDGELIVGSAMADDCYNKTVREVMTIDGPCTATYYVFDHWVWNDAPFWKRLKQARAIVDLFKGSLRIVLLEQTIIHSQDELDTYEEYCTSQGFEGVMIRQPDAPYKYGRSTPREGYLLKVKRFVDSECIIIDMLEKMHNANEAIIDETGHTKRSTHLENQHGMDTMGALLVQDCKTSVQFKIGTGFNDFDRQWYWARRHDSREWPVIKYKSFPVGVKDKPRHPVYIGIRDPKDM